MNLQTANEYDFLGQGWSFPPTFNQTVVSVEMVSLEEDIRQSLAILLTTATGERVMQPKFGCNLDELVFESLDTTVKTLIRDKVETAILYFEPRIELLNVKLDDTGELEGRLLLELEYRVKKTNSRTNLVFPFYVGEGALQSGIGNGIVNIGL
ncbi:MAG: GPW/gp25 family protein [Saprospiraceae bacterium]|nr:GPW/gp25 family protein [Saprospiraceae bacterium]